MTTAVLTRSKRLPDIDWSSGRLASGRLAAGGRHLGRDCRPCGPTGRRPSKCLLTALVHDHLHLGHDGQPRASCTPADSLSRGPRAAVHWDIAAGNVFFWAVDMGWIAVRSPCGGALCVARHWSVMTARRTSRTGPMSRIIESSVSPTLVHHPHSFGALPPMRRPRCGATNPPFGC